MGHELWTSRFTGYRRSGTRLSDLRAATGTAGVVRTIAEPLRSIQASLPAEEARNLLEPRRFDLAGVQENAMGPVIGFVRTKDLTRGIVKDHLKTMTPEHLISDGATLGQLLETLKTREQVFMLTGASINAIVTRADLNKPPVRVYLFGIVSLLEMHLRYWAKTRWPEERWQTVVNEARLAKANALLEQRRKHNEDTLLIDCLQFCDLLGIVISGERLRAELGLGSKKQGREMLGNAESLRNDLAHSQADLAFTSDWDSRLSLIDSIERTLERSEELVLREAQSAPSASFEV